MTAGLKNKYLGCMIGSALGDAIGELAFRYAEKDHLCVELQRTKCLRYTDDTAMAIGLAESLMKLRTIDQRDLGETFSRNYAREPWRGYAMGPPSVFAQVKRSGTSYAEAARALFGGSGSYGNGAAMRVAPVGLFFHNAAELYEKACASAEVTHAHPIGADGAAVEALGVAQAVRLDPGEEFPREVFLRELIAFSRTAEIREKMKRVQGLITHDVPPDLAARDLGRSVAVHESMPFAIYAFVRYPKSFEDCLYCAVLNGGDRDTLGAMACAISGAYLGLSAIPAGWQGKLENATYIGELAIGLAES